MLFSVFLADLFTLFPSNINYFLVNDLDPLLFSFDTLILGGLIHVGSFNHHGDFPTCRPDIFPQCPLWVSLGLGISETPALMMYKTRLCVFCVVPLSLPPDSNPYALIPSTQLPSSRNLGVI